MADPGFQVRGGAGGISNMHSLFPRRAKRAAVWRVLGYAPPKMFAMHVNECKTAIVCDLNQSGCNFCCWLGPASSNCLLLIDLPKSVHLNPCYRDLNHNWLSTNQRSATFTIPWTNIPALFPKDDEIIISMISNQYYMACKTLQMPRWGVYHASYATDAHPVYFPLPPHMHTWTYTLLHCMINDYNKPYIERQSCL